jgi:hypothetical protein
VRRICPNCFALSADPEGGGGVPFNPIDTILSKRRSNAFTASRFWLPGVICVFARTMDRPGFPETSLCECHQFGRSLVVAVARLLMLDGWNVPARTRM